MNVNKKEEVSYDITSITKDQAQDLLHVCCINEDKILTRNEKETLNNLRQALLDAGVTLP